MILSKVSKELNDYEGNVWTVILSLRREDAERLGFDQGERWRDLLRAHAQELSDQFHIPMENLRWYAAFHNESHHPHCHLMVFSSDPKEGYLSKQGFHSLRESLIKEIFAQDLMNEYSVEWLTKSAEQGYTVAKYKLGKMFLHGDQVQKNLAYALRWLEDAVRDNNPYAEYLLGKCFLLGLELDQDILRGEEFLRKAIQQRNRFAEYTLGKALLDGKLVLQDIPEAIKHLTASADQGLPTAQYVIGKLLYQGELLPRDVLAALDRLEAAAAQKNPYAAYLAAKIRLVKGEYKDVFGHMKDEIKYEVEKCDTFEKVKALIDEDFIWDKKAHPKRIYPVLVLGNQNYLNYGITYILNRYFSDELQQQGIVSKAISELLIIDIDTLILYADLFSNKSFEKIVRDYFSKIKKHSKSSSVLDRLFGFMQPFPEYLKQKYPLTSSHLMSKIKQHNTWKN